MDTFERSCKMAAVKDDGKIDREEAKQLAKLQAAVERFRKDLDKLL